MFCLGAPAQAKPWYPGQFTPEKKLNGLEKKVGLKNQPLENPQHLKKTRAKAQAAKNGDGNLRILQLGDSHIAADFITSMSRHQLQKAFGDGGRGFMHIDQLWGFGGRRLKRKESAWTRTRVVDRRGPGKPYGFSGMSLVAKKKATINYKVLPGDRLLRIYYHAHPKGGEIEVLLGKDSLLKHATKSAKVESRVVEVSLPKIDKPSKLKLTATKGSQIFGLAFENKKPGVIFESVGPVGADAKVYLQLEQNSLKQHLTAHKPDLVILMVGGNDALKSRKGWTDLKKVEKDHRDLLAVLKGTLPNSECLFFAPMDAGDKKGGKVRSKKLLTEMRDLQRKLAGEAGCGFWDTYAAMGGPGAIAKWHRAKVMNKDLVHPKKPAADLLGRAFAGALLKTLQ